MLAMSHFDTAHSKYMVASRKIASGDRLTGKDLDLGGISSSMNLSSDKQKNQAEKISLQNFIGLIEAQENALMQVNDLYDRMSQLAFRSLDIVLADVPTNGSSDKSLLNKEFQEISAALKSLIDQQVGGRRLFGGVKSDFTDGLQDRNDFSPTNLPQITTKDVLSTSGKVKIEFCPGGAEDQIWVFQGDIPDELADYFVAPADGSDANTSELTDKLYEYFDGSKDKDFQGIFTTGRWQTVGVSTEGRNDTFEIDFDTCDASLEVNFDNNNVTEIGVLPPNPSDTDILSANFDDLFGPELKKRLELEGELLLNAPSGNSTKITMIGVNTGNRYTYEVSASFEPSLPYNDLTIATTGEIFQAISFGAIDCSDITTSENAQNALNQLDAQRSVIHDSLAQIGAARSRYASMIEMLDQETVNLELAHSKIADSDIAKEATNLAKHAISMQVSANALTKSTNLYDSLIEMTTKHFRSHVLNSIL